MKYTESDYIYGSTRVRAIENRAVGSERINRAAEQRSLSDALRILEEGGLRLSSGGDDALSALVCDAYRVLGEVAPDPTVFLPLRYIYDCHNIKSVIKASLRGENASDILIPVGTCDTSALISMGRERVFEGLPEHMNAAVPDAYERYYHSSDPREIDFTLDRACFDDMSDAAKASGCPFMLEYVNIRADMTNLLTAVRLLRINADATLFGRVFVDGGRLGQDFFKPTFAVEDKKEAEASLYASLSRTVYNRLGLSPSDSLTRIERAVENTRLSFVLSRRAGELYGAATLCGYVQNREVEAQNIRIVIAGREADLPPEIIKERLRAV